MSLFDSFMRFNTLVFHQSRLMELSGIFQLVLFYSFNIWAILHKLNPEWDAYESIDTVYNTLFLGLILIVIGMYCVVKIIYKINEGLYPTAQSMKNVRLLMLINCNICLTPTYYCLISLFMSNDYTAKAVIVRVFGSLFIGLQIIFTYFSFSLNLYYKLPLHQGIGRFDTNAQTAELLLLVAQGFGFIFDTPWVAVVIGVGISLYLCRRGLMMPSFQSFRLCQFQLSVYFTYCCLMLLQVIFLVFTDLNVCGAVFTIVECAVLVILFYGVFRSYVKSFSPDISVIRITQALLRGQLNQNEYTQKLTALMPLHNICHFLACVHFISNFDLVEEMQEDQNSHTNSEVPDELTLDLLSTRHKGHFLLANTVFNCLNVAESKYENCHFLKSHIVRYCWINFGVIEEKNRAIELENQIILGKRTCFSSYTLVLISTIRKLKDLCEFSTENDLTVLMKNSYEVFCTEQMKQASTSLYTILKALESGKDPKLALLSSLFVVHAKKSFKSIKELFQKYPQDPTTLKLLSLYLTSIENDSDAGSFVIKTMESFDLNKGEEMNILDIAPVKEEFSHESQKRKGSFSQFDYVGKFLVINENMKKTRFDMLQWQKQFHYVIKFTFLIFIFALITCVFFNGYILINYFALQLSYSQVASTLPYQRQRADSSYLSNSEDFIPNLRQLQNCTTLLISMGKLDGYNTIQYLDTATLWSPSVINKTHYTLIPVSYVDANLDQMTLHASSMLSEDLKTTFISFCAMTTSRLQIGRLEDYEKQLEARLMVRNLYYFEYSFIPVIASSMLLLIIVILVYLSKIKSECKIKITDIRAKALDIQKLVVVMKAKIFANVEDHHTHLNQSMNAYNLKAKSKSKNIFVIIVTFLFILCVVSLFMYIIYSVREDAMNITYFQSHLAMATTSILFSFYHIQSLGYMNITTNPIVNFHADLYRNSTQYSLGLMSASMANLASYVRNPYFTELTNYEYYTELILEKYCTEDLCEESLGFEVNEFTRAIANCFNKGCVSIKDVLDTATRLSIWSRLELMELELINEDLLTKRRLIIILVCLSLTIVVVISLAWLVNKMITDKQNTISGYE